MERSARTGQLRLTSVEGVFRAASNATLLARDVEGLAWVYKPEQGEQPLWDFPLGTLARREVACYLISEAVGLGVVPETRLADGPYGPGSAQRFLDEDLTWDPRPLITVADPALWPVVVLDLLTNNADRKIGHLLREPADGRIWAIDNGLTFHVEEKLRTVLWSFAGREIPATLLERLDPGDVGGVLANLLEPAEVAATVARATRILDEPTHPHPPPDRPPMPWPLW